MSGSERSLPETMLETVGRQTPEQPFGLRINQPSFGYRFTSDAVALADFVQISASEDLLDLCTGVGTIPLLLWQRRHFRQAVGVELQKELVSLALENVRQNQLADRIRIVQHDIRELSRGWLKRDCLESHSAGFDVVSSNPPYWPVNNGRINPGFLKAAARHEICLTLSELLKAGCQILKPGGRLYLVHLLEREPEIVMGLKTWGFAVRRRQHLERRNPLLLIEAQHIA